MLREEWEGFPLAAIELLDAVPLTFNNLGYEVVGQQRKIGCPLGIPIAILFIECVPRDLSAFLKLLAVSPRERQSFQ